MNRDHSTYASIDIGSHTSRMLIARLEEGQSVLPLVTERRITRLARNFRDGGTLDSARMSQSIEVLKEYARLIKDHGVRSVACGATGVVRRARNGKAFLDNILDLTGLRVSILSETSEAILSAKGIISVLPNRPEIILSFDLGGGSTEFVLMDIARPQPIWSTSVSIGATTITERYLRGDPPSSLSIGGASATVRDALAEPLAMVAELLKAAGPASPPPLVVGTAGTVTTLAAMHLEMNRYVPFRVNGLNLDKSWLEPTIDRLARSSLASRRAIPGLEAGREDIILGGALIVREILEGMRQDRLTVTDAGLLEGLLLDLIENEFGCSQPLVSPLTWQLQKE
jgi:exopolyphosphatase / guanosine-5'-triphosphate,3'-diphosphate pyrophosphatase